MNISNMSKIKFIIIFVVLLISLQLISCANNISKEQNDISDEENNIEDNRELEGENANEELKSLLPQRENYRWIYNGFAEYGHQMDLIDIIDLKDSIIYSVKGNIFDLSDGEGEGNFELKIVYSIKDGMLIQSKSEEKMMDSIFDELILIKSPLEEGTEWNQEVVDKTGKQYNLRCYIEDIREDNGVKTYSVVYDDLNSDYYEKREIQEGIGVINFQRLYQQNGDSFSIGYSLYEAASGYENYLEVKKYLPPLNKRLVYHGLAEYGHSGTLRKISENQDEAVYEFLGEFEDGSGLGGTFKISYIINYLDNTVTEKVTENTRTNGERINSILKDLIILKLPIETGNKWTQSIEIDGKNYRVEGKIIDISYEDQSYYPVEKIDMDNPVVKVRYVVEGIEGYFNNTYIEERRFQVGKGMIGFSKLLEGELSLSGKDLEDIYKVNSEIINNMFGYSLSFIE